jgi:hypothetical protein
MYGPEFFLGLREPSQADHREAAAASAVQRLNGV